MCHGNSLFKGEDDYYYEYYEEDANIPATAAAAVGEDDIPLSVDPEKLLGNTLGSTPPIQPFHGYCYNR